MNTVAVVGQLSFCHRTMSDAKYWIIRTLFLEINTLCLEESVVHLFRTFHSSNVPVDFFEFLSTEFAACLKPSNRDNRRMAFYQRTQQCDQGAS